MQQHASTAVVMCTEKRWRFSNQAVILIEQPGKLNIQLMSLPVCIVSLVFKLYMIGCFQSRILAQALTMIGHLFQKDVFDIFNGLLRIIW